MRSKLRNLLTSTTVKPTLIWLHRLSTIDSTNIYANQLLSDGMAQHGDVVWALEQTAGKGQRGKTWIATASENIFMSVILLPDSVLQPFPDQLNFIITTTLANYFQAICPNNKIEIKWPNDVFINAKKTAGILIENSFKGDAWSQSVVGIGINVNQVDFPAELTRATSLKLETQKEFELEEIVKDLRTGILNAIYAFSKGDREKFTLEYNKLLFGRGKRMNFRLKTNSEAFEAEIIEVDQNGKLILGTPDGLLVCTSGSLIWEF